MKIQIEVAFAGDASQMVIPLEMGSGSKLKAAILQSGILQKFPELGTDCDSLKNRVGIFGERKTLDTVLQTGDRVEIYKSLKIDPKEARRERALKERAQQKKIKLEIKNKGRR